MTETFNKYFPNGLLIGTTPQSEYMYEYNKACRLYGDPETYNVPSAFHKTVELWNKDNPKIATIKRVTDIKTTKFKVNDFWEEYADEATAFVVGVTFVAIVVMLVLSL